MKKRLEILLCFYITLLSCTVYAASQQALSLQHYDIEGWNTPDGLPHSSINDITQCDNGYLWLATWEGPVRFNGSTFVTYNRKDSAALSNPGSRHLHCSKNDTLWLAGVNGDVISYSEHLWQQFSPINSMIYDIQLLADNSLLLATAGSGLLHVRQKKIVKRFTRQSGLPADYIYDVEQTASGQVLVATARGLVLFDRALTAAQAISPLGNTEVYALLQDADGGVYAASNAGVFYAAPWQELPQFNLLSAIAASTLLLDNYGLLWFGGVSSDLYRLYQGEAQPLRLDNDLSANRVISLFLDDENSIWAGTSNGLKRIREVPFTNLTRYNGLQDNFVRTVLESSDGSLWIGSSAGLDVQYSDGTVHSVLQNISVLSLAQDSDGNIWVGSRNAGAIQLQQEKQQRFDTNAGLRSADVRSITSRQGLIWLGTANGLHTLNPATGQIQRLETSAKNSFILAQLWLADGSLLLGTNEGAGIWRDNHFNVIAAGTELPQRRILGLYQDKNPDIVWLATDKGLGRYRRSADTLQFLALEAGLPSDTILQVVQDNNSNLWLSTNRGIVWLDHANTLTYLDGQTKTLAVQLFNEKDGMRSAQTNGGSNPAAILRQNGSLVFATAAGVSEVQPKLLSRHIPKPPHSKIEQLTADGKTLPFSAKGITLPAGTERLTIQLAGLGFIAPERIQLRTRLLGFDKEWTVRGGNNTLAEYTNLPPGEYEFQTAAAYTGGKWSEVLSMPLIIQPFVWQYKSFWLVLLLLLLLAAERMIYIRTRRAIQEQAKLERLVAEKTKVLQKQTDHLLAMDKERLELLNKIQQQAEFFSNQARQDMLTGLRNRRAFGELAEQEFKRLQRYPNPLCVAITDIDHFKSINDTYSHATGDVVLQRVARVLASQCREIDTVARWGGEEFVLLFPQTSLSDAISICEKLRQQVSKLDFSEVDTDLVNLTVTISFGVASFDGEPDYERLLARADKALYRAKKTGRNKVVSAASRPDN